MSPEKRHRQKRTGDFASSIRKEEHKSSVCANGGPVTSSSGVYRNTVALDDERDSVGAQRDTEPQTGRRQKEIIAIGVIRGHHCDTDGPIASDRSWRVCALCVCTTD